MSDINDSNQGPGWNDHSTPTGTIHSYDGNSSSNVSTGGNSGNAHSGITENTRLSIATTKNYNGTYMSMCTTNLKVHEGFKNNMYKDSEGNVTVGIGHLLANSDMAASLPFTRTRTVHGHGDDMMSEVSVPSSEIRSTFDSYKAGTGSAPTALHLSNDAVIGQCIKDVQTTEAGLRGLYSGYDDFSNARKTALVDMGFNLGIPKLTKSFPKFNAAVNRGDWNEAAAQSHRTLNQRGDQRNIDTAAQLKSDL